MNCDHTLAVQTREEQMAEGQFGVFRRMKYRTVDNSRLLVVARKVRKHQQQTVRQCGARSRIRLQSTKNTKRDIIFNMAELTSGFEKEHSTLAEIAKEIRGEEQKRHELTMLRNEAGRLFRIAEFMSSSACASEMAPPSQQSEDGRISLLGADGGSSTTSPTARHSSVVRLSRLKEQKMLATPAVQRLALDTLKAAVGELSPESSDSVCESVMETGPPLIRTSSINDKPLTMDIKDRIVCRFATTAAQPSTIAINKEALSRKQETVDNSETEAQSLAPSSTER